MENSLKANFQAKIAEQKALDKAYKDARDKKSGQNKQQQNPNKVGFTLKKEWQLPDSSDFRAKVGAGIETSAATDKNYSKAKDDDKFVVVVSGAVSIILWEPHSI